MPAAGAIIGDHQLVRQIGRGGMGTVWEALHLPTGARRALKLVPPGGDRELRQRFLREVEAQARVDDHPHVGRVHAAGQTPAGELWLAMDLLPGGDLAERLRPGPLEPGEAARIGAALARGLAHVHARGVLHRDIKPHNVLFDAEGRPRLVDFGLARVAGPSDLTASGALLGTPAYAAPEQVEDARAAGPQADVYGLGALLYHLLGGSPPFAGMSLPALVRAVLLDPPRPLRALNPAVPPALEALCLRCLEKDPARRPPGAAALAEALERLAASPEPAPRSGASARRLLGAGALLTLAAVGGALALPGRRTRAGAGEVSPSPPPAPAPPPPAREAPRPLDVRALAPRSSGELTPELCRELGLARDGGIEALERTRQLALAMPEIAAAVTSHDRGDPRGTLRLGQLLVSQRSRELGGVLLRQAALHRPPCLPAVAAWGEYLLGCYHAVHWPPAEGLGLLRAVAADPHATWSEREALVGALLEAGPGSLEQNQEAVALLEREVAAGELAAEPWLGLALLRPSLPDVIREQTRDLRQARALLQRWAARSGEAVQERPQLRFLRALAASLLDSRAGEPDPAGAGPLYRRCLELRDEVALSHLVTLEAGRRLSPTMIPHLAQSLRTMRDEEPDKPSRRAYATMLLLVWAEEGRDPTAAAGEEALLRAELERLEASNPDLIRPILAAWSARVRVR